MSKLKEVKSTAPAVSLGLSKELEAHLREGYRQVRNAYSFLAANNTRYAQEQLRAGLSNLDRVLAPWL